MPLSYDHAAHAWTLFDLWGFYHRTGRTMLSKYKEKKAAGTDKLDVTLQIIKRESFLVCTQIFMLKIIKNK